jgi:cation diffusion facilitator CzcD-associated flavoprotein CzcO
MTEIAIIGAGPYGLSIAAHLASREIPFRIFGQPMASWSDHMPKGMHLKSEGFASSLSHPQGEFTLKDYCAKEGIEYRDVGFPVKLETFVAYGRAFQRKFVPNLEEKLVTRLEPSQSGFQLVLDNQERVLARHVIVATGITNFGWIPEILRSLPTEMVSHSWQQSDLTPFRGKRVAVVGAGASALDLATLLHEGGASVELVSRRVTIPFYSQPQEKRHLRIRVRRPQTPIGQGGWELLFYVHAPGLFRLLPESVRLDRVRKTLGPATPWHVRDRIAGKIPFHLGVTINAATAENGRVRLELTKEAELAETIEVDHVIAATGYLIDLDQLSFLDTKLRGRIRLTAGAPLLSAKFESSVPGLYFVGLAAANTFGPYLRFACGAEFAARRLAEHFAKQAPREALMPATQDAKA